MTPERDAIANIFVIALRHLIGLQSSECLSLEAIREELKRLNRRKAAGE